MGKNKGGYLRMISARAPESAPLQPAPPPCGADPRQTGSVASFWSRAALRSHHPPQTYPALPPGLACGPSEGAQEQRSQPGGRQQWHSSPGGEPHVTLAHCRGLQTRRRPCNVPCAAPTPAGCPAQLEAASAAWTAPPTPLVHQPPEKLAAPAPQAPAQDRSAPSRHRRPSAARPEAAQAHLAQQAAAPAT